MEPKNPIVIDGVDVSGCIYYQYNMCTATKDNYGDCSFYCKDYEMKDCYYKQLKRKEQECERLKNELSTYGATGICEVCTEKSVLQNDKYTKALKEIKDIAEENIRIADLEGLNGVYRRGLAKQILQKINEVNK